MPEAEEFGNENYDDDWGWLDRDLLDESQYHVSKGSDDYYLHTFFVDDEGVQTESDKAMEIYS